MLVIGFINPTFQANENDGFVTVEFGILLNGGLQTEVSIELFFSDSVALSKFYAQYKFQSVTTINRWQ